MSEANLSNKNKQATSAGELVNPVKSKKISGTSKKKQKRIPNLDKNAASSSTTGVLSQKSEKKKNESLKTNSKTSSLTNQEIPNDGEHPDQNSSSELTKNNVSQVTTNDNRDVQELDQDYVEENQNSSTVDENAEEESNPPEAEKENEEDGESQNEDQENKGNSTETASQDSQVAEVQDIRKIRNRKRRYKKKKTVGTDKKPELLPALSVMLANVRSIKSFEKLNELCRYFHTHDYKIMVITESWLDESIPDTMFTVFGISIYRCDRNIKLQNKEHGGGVALLYKPPLMITKLDIHQEDHLKSHQSQILACRVVMPANPDVNFNLVAVYRPPQTNSVQIGCLITHLASFLPRSDYVLVGDFNFKEMYTTSDGSDSETTKHQFMKFIRSRKMIQHVEKPTREENILDLVCSSPRIIVADLKVRQPILKSDHNPVSFTVTTSSIFEPNKNILRNKFFPMRDSKILNFNISNYDFENLSRSITSKNWKHIFSTCQTNDACFNMFQSVLLELARLFVPKNQSNENFSDIPVLTYRKQCAKTSNVLSNKLEPKNEKHIDFDLIKDGKTISTDSEKALLFARQFRLESKSICISNRITGPVVNDTLPFPDLSQLFSPSAVKNALKQVTPKFHFDKFYGSVLEKCAEALATPLSILFIKILQTGDFPDAWNHYIVVPDVPTVREHICNPENYNMQFFLNPFMTVMEKIICDHLHNENKHKLSPRTKNGSLSNYTMYMTSSTKRVDVIHFKLKDVFNRIPHNVLISKLKDFDIHSIFCNWFNWLIFPKTFSIQINGYLESKKHKFHVGPIQGSDSRAFMFFLYINSLLVDIPLDISCSAVCDDLEIYSNTLKNVEKGLRRIEKWCDTNRLVIPHDDIDWYQIGEKTKTELKFANKKIKRTNLNREQYIPPSEKIFFELSATSLFS